MLKTTRSADTMLAFPNCAFNSDEFFHSALEISANHASNCDFTLGCTDRATRFWTKSYKVRRAMTLTSARLSCSHHGSKRHLRLCRTLIPRCLSSAQPLSCY